MTSTEKLDFAALRQEMREGFRDLTAEVKALGDRVGSLEVTRSNQEAIAKERSERRLSTNSRVAIVGGIVGTFYGLVTLAKSIGLI